MYGTVGQGSWFDHAFDFKCMPLFIFQIKEKDIYMNSPCGAKALECQDYSKCDCTDETACRWWAYDRQVADSAVSNTQHECALHNAAEAESYGTKTQSDFKASPSPSWEARHPAWSREAILPGQKCYLCFSHAPDKTTVFAVGNRVDNTFSCVSWCVLYSCVCMQEKMRKKKHQERARAHVCRSASISCLAWLHCYWLYSVISLLVWFGAENCKQLTHLLFPLSPHSANG